MTARPPDASEPTDQVRPTESLPPTEPTEPAHSVTYVATAPVDAELEAGEVFLDQRLIGRLSRRLRVPAPSERGGPALDPSTDSVWHAEAIGWLPHQGRQWDRRITTTAPTRRRAAEDLLRAYGNQR